VAHCADVFRSKCGAPSLTMWRASSMKSSANTEILQVNTDVLESLIAHRQPGCTLRLHGRSGRHILHLVSQPPASTLKFTDTPL